VSDPSLILRRRIRWTTDATNDLEQIFTHIIKENPTAARDVVRAITDGISKLKDFPKLGRSGQVEGTREMVFRSLPYIAVYRVKESAIEILRIYHAAQDWP
jgi:addiction module RelE/StbE family toxin